jgi:hypothetical protein
MGKEYYDRYQSFKFDGKYLPLPYIILPPKSSDKSVVYSTLTTRLDKLSQKYYDNPYHGWLILLANPSFGGLENNIFDGAMLKIPFPLDNSLLDYKNAIENYYYFYGR